MLVYYIYFTPKDSLRIDFVEDVQEIIKPPRIVEGIKILSLEDIYLRKIFALAGIKPVLDETGRKEFVGGRTEAKDLFDIYFLSHTFMPLSQFVEKYGNFSLKEGLIHWFRTYDRMQIKEGILSLETDKDTDYKIIEKHFNAEIDKIIESEIGEI